MGEGLDWMLTLDADTSGGDRFLRTLDRLDKTMTGLDHKLDQVGVSSRKAGEGHKKHAQEASGLDGALKSLGHSFTGVVELLAEWDAAKFLLGLPERLFHIGEVMLTTAAKTERTGKAFGLLFGNDVGKGNLEYIESIANFTEFTDDRLKGAALQLGKVGFKGNGLDRALAASQDMAAFSDNPEEGFSEALASLSRIKRTGRIDNRVLGGLGIGEKDFFAELAVRTGKSADSLKDAMDKGTLDTEDAIENLYTMITEKTGKDLGGAGVEMSKSLTSVLTHLRDLPDQYFQKLVDTPGFLTFKGELAHVLDVLDPTSPQGAQIFSALEEGFNEVGDVLKDIDSGAVFKELASDIGPVVHALKETADLVITIGHGFHEIKDAIAEADYAMKGGNDFVNKWTPMGFLKDHGLTGMQRGHDPMLPDRIRKLIANDVTAPGAATPAPAGMSTSLDNEWMSGFEDQGAKAGMSVEAGFRKKTRTHSPSDAFRDVGRDLAAGLHLGMTSGMDESTMSLPPSFSGGRGAGVVHITVNSPVSVNGDGLTGAAVAEEISQRLRSLLPTHLTSAFEQFAIESGD